MLRKKVGLSMAGCGELGRLTELAAGGWVEAGLEGREGAAMVECVASGRVRAGVVVVEEWVQRWVVAAGVVAGERLRAGEVTAGAHAIYTCAPQDLYRWLLGQLEPASPRSITLTFTAPLSPFTAPAPFTAPSAPAHREAPHPLIFLHPSHARSPSRLLDRTALFTPSSSPPASQPAR